FGFGLSDLAEVDLIVFVLDGAAGLRQVDYLWFSRLRALGKPILPVLNKADIVERRAGENLARIEARLGTKVVPVCACDGRDVLEGLVPRMLKLCPELAVPLGREIAPLRRKVAEGLIRQAVAFCGLLGMEPLPLLDIPFQLLTQVRLVARLAVLYGYAPPATFQRETLATVLGGLGIRYLAQAVAKVVPVLGWIASGLLAAAGTWLLGYTALAYFERNMSLGLGRIPVERWKEHIPQIPNLREVLKEWRICGSWFSRLRGLRSRWPGANP
ncbi:MAG TPA: DUF697 domain-containing protein, partial [Chloroflexi bacterium]|nr:DUF697 domain-containing protein [Chloroflexota bacterium]